MNNNKKALIAVIVSAFATLVCLYKLNVTQKQLRSYQLDVRNNIYVLYDGDRVIDTLSSRKCELDSAIMKDNL